MHMYPLRVLLSIFVVVTNSSLAETYHVAAGSSVANPEQGTYLAGYGQDRKAEGKHDDLYLKAAIIQTQNEANISEALVLFTLDNIGLTRPDILEIKRKVQEILPSAEIVFSSTHTHAGPDVVGIWGDAPWRSGRNQNYIDRLTQTSVSLVIELMEKLTPATS